MDYIGVAFAKCEYCDNLLQVGDTIPYCDYKCNLGRMREKKKEKHETKKRK